MTTTRSVLPAAFGFAFVAICFAQSFWVAVACLLGAAVAHLGALLARGETSLGELQERAEAARTGFRQPGNVPRADGGGSRVV